VSILIAIPVYNEARTVRAVVERVRGFADHVLVVDDGSTDETAEVLESLRRPLGLDLIRHEGNLGYGRSLRDAFARAADRGFDWVITMDCDEQHEPEEIPGFVARIAGNDADIVSGSRYLDLSIEPSGEAPTTRRAINRAVTEELNRRLGLSLTDGFCGFKAHRVELMRRLRLTESGYAFPMQFWVQCVAAGARIAEHPVRLIYNDPNRSFGGDLDDPAHRLMHYRKLLHAEICRLAHRLPAGAAEGLLLPCGGSA
jgi:dolichol-phosphate mannosyltransferase